MITCRDLVEQLFDLAANLPTDTSAPVEQHLQGCSSCRAYLQSYRLTITMSRRLPRPTLPPTLAERLRLILNEPEV